MLSLAHDSAIRVVFPGQCQWVGVNNVLLVDSETDESVVVLQLSIESVLLKPVPTNFIAKDVATCYSHDRCIEYMFYFVI